MRAPFVVGEHATSSALQVKGERESGGSAILRLTPERGARPKAELRIGEVAERCGIATSAIRYYESEGLIAKPARRGGRRVYDESIVDRLGLVELAKRAGFSVAEIRKLLAGFSRRTPPGARWRALTRAKVAELDARIAEAERMKRVLEVIMRCRCPSLDDCGRAMASRRSRRR